MEKICDRENLNLAYKKVKANHGAPGIDGMNIEQLGPWIRDHKMELIEGLLKGTYCPQPVKGVEIPKPGGGRRQLGIPTVIDRLIQQAILQILQPIYEPTFSESSYGFRPRRSAHQALLKASEYVRDEKTVVVDIDLEQFFDRVNHDILMSRLARRIGDKRLLRLIRRFLQAGMMKDGLMVDRQEGTPQGGPLSPLLSNIILDDLDKELELRGHSFCRYADDCNIYVGTIAAGERVMKSVVTFVEKRLKLRVNREKSAVDYVWNRKFLGHRVLPKGKLGIAPKSLMAAKDRIRTITRRGRGRKLSDVVSELNQFLTGWITYFRHAAMATNSEKLDLWIAIRLRTYRIKQCKDPGTIAKLLIRQGVPIKVAWAVVSWARGSWQILATSRAVVKALGPSWIESLKLVKLSERFAKLNT
jgi:RNA-directed DNA polymerase